jgi:hypothetical protein
MIRKVATLSSLLFLGILLSTASAAVSPMRDSGPRWPPDWWQDLPSNAFDHGFFGFAFSGEGHPYDAQLFFDDAGQTTAEFHAQQVYGQVWDWDYEFRLHSVYDVGFTALLYLEWVGTIDDGGLLFHTLEGPSYVDWVQQTYRYEDLGDGRFRVGVSYSLRPSPMDVTPTLHMRGEGSYPDTVWVGIVVLFHESMDLIHNDPPEEEGPRRAATRAMAASPEARENRETSWGRLKARYARR